MCHGHSAIKDQRHNTAVAGGYYFRNVAIIETPVAPHRLKQQLPRQRMASTLIFFNWLTTTGYEFSNVIPLRE